MKAISTGRFPPLAAFAAYAFIASLAPLSAQAATQAAAPPSTADASTNIMTADQYFQEVSDRYTQINDYSCKLTISTGKATMIGNLIYRAPSLLRIDFTSPPDQVIAFDGQTLQVYIPEYHAVLSQSVSTASGSAGAGLATREGLKMMKRNYGIAFETSPDPVVLSGGTEKVVRLVLTRKTVAEGFRTITVSVAADSKLIRRLEGTTLANENFTFDFTGMKLNQNIPEGRFIYDSPASANVYNNFLFNSAASGN